MEFVAVFEVDEQPDDGEAEKGERLVEVGDGGIAGGQVARHHGGAVGQKPGNEDPVSDLTQ